MLKHFFKIAIRNLVRQKGLAFINVFGLSVGLACFTLFLLYAVNEFSFDRFHKNAKDIYRVYLHVDPMRGREAKEGTYSPVPLGPALKQDFPEIENYVRIQDAWTGDFVRADNKVSRVKVSYADPQFFSVFSFKLLYGNSTALNNPGNIVLTKEIALQLFGEANAIGKMVEIKTEDKFEPFTVSAVADNIPSNSTIRLISLEVSIII